MSTTTAHQAARPDSSEWSLLRSEPGDRTVRSESEHRFRPAVIRIVAGYAVLSVVLLGIGLLLTHPLNGTVGRWDEHVNDWLVRHRTTGWNSVTQAATGAVNTLPVIVLAALVAGFLAWRRRIREAAFLILALVVEITVFLSVTFIVARPRPDVPRLNSTPATSSFPSGHTAAATVLCVGVALDRGLLHDEPSDTHIQRDRRCCHRRPRGLLACVRGMHHPTDVIFGAIFGLACLAVAASAVASVPSTDAAT